MKSFLKVSIVVFVAVLSLAYVYADDSAVTQKDNQNEEENIKIYKRLIPADVLRG